MDAVTYGILSGKIKALQAELDLLASAIKWIGVTSTALTDGASTNPIVINNENVTAVSGDVTSYDNTEFIFNGSVWQAFGPKDDPNYYIFKVRREPLS